MRILTVRQPWALHIIQSGKDVENRTRNIAGGYRGDVAIHAGLRADEEALRRLPGLAPNGIARHFHYGAIIGVAVLTDVHQWPDCQTDAHPTCSEWAEPNAWHLVLRDRRPLREPIPFKGGLGLRLLHPDQEAQVRDVSAR